MHALAPIAFINDMKSPLFRTLVLFLDFITAATKVLRISEFMPYTKFLVDSNQLACQDNAMFQDVCSNILFLIAGFNSEQLNKVKFMKVCAKLLVKGVHVWTGRVLSILLYSLQTPIQSMFFGLVNAGHLFLP